MNALVTGATGFLGSRLTRELAKRGHRVDVIARSSSSYVRIADVVPAARRHVVDETPASMRRAVAAAQPDVVFHLATYYARDHRPEDLAPMLEANVAFPLRLVDAMVRDGVTRFVDTASAWQFTGTATYRPVCLHSATKAAFDAIVTYFVQAEQLDCVTLAMHDSYGAGDPRRKIFSILREHAGDPNPLAMSGGEQLVDFIHVDDAVAAYLVAAERLRAPHRVPGHELFSVSGGAPATLRDVVETFVRLAHIDVVLAWGGRPYHPREVMQPWAGGTALPGWAPNVDLATGLAALAQEHARNAVT